MAKKIAQYRYYGENNSKNFPNSINQINLVSGTIFSSTMPIIQLGIQALPGTKFRLNNSVEYVIIGSTGIYEIDVDGISSITALSFESDSITTINEVESAYLIVDIIYDN